MLLSTSQCPCCDVRGWFVGAKDERFDFRSIVDSITMTHQTLIDSLRLSIRAALAAGLAVGIAQLLDLQFPIYAMITAVIVTDVAAPRTRELALSRLAGTILGALLGAMINPLLQPGAWGVGLSVLAAMFLSHLFRLQHASKLAGYVCGIVVLNYGDDSWSYALHRVIETILGIGLAVLVSFVPRLIPPDEQVESAQPSQEPRTP